MRQMLISFDQFVCTFLVWIRVFPGEGWADETISARCWRLRMQQPYKFLLPVIDGLFFRLFNDHNHCMTSFVYEVIRNQLPPDER